MRITRYLYAPLLLFVFPVIADAEKLRLDATGTNIFGNFVIVFEDDGDGLLQHDEILYFSGVNGNSSTSGPLNYDGVAYVPDIAGIATASGTFNPNIPCTECWELAPSNFGDVSDGWFPTRWTYAIAPYSEPSRNMTFTYEFQDASGNPWGQGAILRGGIQGTVMPDGDTVIIDGFGTVTLTRPGLPLFVYDDIEATEFNNYPNVDNAAQMSFSGLGNQFRSCPEGFDPQFPFDCSFSNSPGGGFAIGPSSAGGLLATAADGSGQAVCPGTNLQAGCRVRDFPFEPSRWDLVVAIPADRCTIQAGGCNPTGSHLFTLPDGFVPPPGAEISQFAVPFIDPRADANGRCDGQTPLVLFDGDLIIPPDLCGSPEFLVIVTEANFFIPEGTIDNTVFPEDFVSNPIVCDVPITGDPQLQSTFVWQPGDSSEVLEGSAISLGNGCGSSRARIRGFSFIVSGLHYDFGLDFDADPEAVTQAFVDLTSTKLEFLVQAVVKARPSLSRRHFFRLWSTAVLAKFLHKRGRYQAASRVVGTFIRLTERSRFKLNEEINNEGNLLSRGDNIRFLLDEYVVPFARKRR